MKKIMGVLLICGFVCVFSGGAYADVILSSDFDDGTLQGWTKGPGFNGELYAVASGGNPGGYMEATDTISGGGALWGRVPGISGSLSHLDEIQWDEFIPDHPLASNGTRIVLLGVDGTYYLASNPVEVVEEWNHRSVRFDDPGAWELFSGSASFNEVIENVDGLFIDMACIGTAPVVEAGIDNVIITTLEPPCWGAGCPQASTVNGVNMDSKSNIMNYLSILLVPVGTVIFMRVLRRKK